MSYQFHPEAETGHLETLAYYEAQQPGLGASSLAEFESALEQVCEVPRRYRPPLLRRAGAKSRLACWGRRVARMSGLTKPKEVTVMDFYDQLSPFYHLIYDDWEASIAWQAERLSHIIRSHWGERVASVLDVSCGIGTQALGLARLGFQVTASDLSPEAIARAQREAQARHVHIPFSVCDMRAAFRHHGGGFDLVLSCDNAVPHLLSDADILDALHAMYACLAPGGGCLITVRAYDTEARGRGIVKPYGLREVGQRRLLLFQVWDFEGEQYALSLYCIEDDLQSGAATTHVMRSRYYAISPAHLGQLMEQAGFAAVQRLDDVFYQPVLVGTRPPIATAQQRCP